MNNIVKFGLRHLDMLLKLESENIRDGLRLQEIGESYLYGSGLAEGDDTDLEIVLVYSTTISGKLFKIASGCESTGHKLLLLAQDRHSLNEEDPLKSILKAVRFYIKTCYNKL